MTSVVLGPFTFRTKGDAIVAVRRVLHSVPLGPPLAGDDLELVRAVLDRHHDRAIKLAGGCVAIVVLQNNAQRRSRGFHIVRRDGATVDFSYRVALDLAPKGPTVEQACRQATWPDILAYRDMRLEDGPQRCEVSGTPLTRENMHVDHGGDWPFRRIVAEFLDVAQREGWPLTLMQRGIYSVEFTDPKVTEAFRRFHNARAQLRLVTSAVNLRGRR